MQRTPAASRRSGRRPRPAGRGCAGGSGRPPGGRSPSAISASTIARQPHRVVHVGRPVERDEHVLARGRRRALARPRALASACPRSGAASRSWCCRRSGCAPASMPSAARFSPASGLWVRSRSDRRSVSTRLISSGIVQSAERRPASTCATGMPSFEAASAQARVEFTSPATTTRSGRSLEQHLLERDQHACRSGRRGCPSRPPGSTSGAGKSEVGEDVVGQPLVVVLAGVHDQLPRRRRAAHGVMTGAIFTKFGRAPTT